jgi:ABC-type dipeptide/oligopeptide/nickel transport system permease subunit
MGPLVWVMVMGFMSVARVHTISLLFFSVSLIRTRSVHGKVERVIARTYVHYAPTIGYSNRISISGNMTDIRP